MKRVIAALLLLVLTAGLLVACSKDESAPEGMKNVAAEEDKFYFYVPTTWVEQRGGATAPNADGSNVVVTTYLPEKGYTPETFWEEKCVPEFETTFKEFETVEDKCGETTLGGMDAGKYVYTASLGAQTYWFMEVITVYGGLVYRLTYTSTAENFDAHLEDVEMMCTNFAFR